MVDEKEPLTKKERRQRQKRLERVRRQARNQVGREAPTVESVATAGAAGGAEPSPAKGPGRPKRPDVTAADITGLKYFEKLKPLLERLHEIGWVRTQGYCMTSLRDLGPLPPHMKSTVMEEYAFRDVRVRLTHLL